MRKKRSEKVTFSKELEFYCNFKNWIRRRNNVNVYGNKKIVAIVSKKKNFFFRSKSNLDERSNGNLCV